MNPDANGTVTWDAVHDTIQAVLIRLDSILLLEFPELQVRGGRSSGRAFTLFSYRSYAADAADDADRIVVGVTFRPEGRDLVATGDVSGESSGDILHELPSRSIPQGSVELLSIAQQIADSLRAGIDSIREGLQKTSRMA